jgi:hypothetical protein
MPQSKLQEQQGFSGPSTTALEVARRTRPPAVAGGTVERQIRDQAADGVDVEVVFPTAGLLCWATPDPAFAMKMCAGWNRWVVDEMGPYMGGDEPKMLPMALIAAGDQDGAMEEIRWAAERGFRGVCLKQRRRTADRAGRSSSTTTRRSGDGRCWRPASSPVPRLDGQRILSSVGGRGGAIINYVCHSMETDLTARYG